MNYNSLFYQNKMADMDNTYQQGMNPNCGCAGNDNGMQTNQYAGWQGYGCGATYDNMNQVVQTCNVEDVPHYVNYHTHAVNN